MKGQCSCGDIQFEMTRKPLFVHACHCTDCQCQTGTAHALNAIIEARNVHINSGKTECVAMQTPSGRGQTIYRCGRCKVAVWSVYGGLGDAFWFVRVGTLENPGACPPDINIFTRSKQAWVPLSEEIPAVDNFYDFKDYWPKDSLQRLHAALKGSG